MPSHKDEWKLPPITSLDDKKSNIGEILTKETLENSSSKLEIALGFYALGNPVLGNLKHIYNLLITGKKDSGKTYLIESFLVSLLLKNSPNDLKLIIIDSSKVDLVIFDRIPHLLSPIITEAEKGISALRWTLAEIDRRNKLIFQAGARNIEAYNELSGFTALPNIVLFIDNYSDLSEFSPVEYNDSMKIILQTGTKYGVYCILTATKPIKEIIGSVQSRIAFLSDGVGENQPAITRSVQFLAPHDFLFVQNRDTFPICLQSPTISDRTIFQLVAFIKNQKYDSEYEETVTRTPRYKIPGLADEIDDLFEDAIRIVCQYDRASASLLQRRLSIGYARAARLVDQLEGAKVLSYSEGNSKPREVLIQDAEAFINKYKHHENGV